MQRVGTTAIVNNISLKIIDKWRKLETSFFFKFVQHFLPLKSSLKHFPSKIVFIVAALIN